MLNATLPGCRFSVRGAKAARAELGRWYAEPAAFEELGMEATLTGTRSGWGQRWPAALPDAARD